MLLSNHPAEHRAPQQGSPKPTAVCAACSIPVKRRHTTPVFIHLPQMQNQRKDFGSLHTLSGPQRGARCYGQDGMWRHSTASSFGARYSATNTLQLAGALPLDVVEGARSNEEAAARRHQRAADASADAPKQMRSKWASLPGPDASEEKFQRHKEKALTSRNGATPHQW